MKLKVMTYNIQSCLGFYSRKIETAPQLAAYIKEVDPDVVVINEIHALGPSDRYPDQPKEIADLLGWNYRFAKAIDIENVGPYGNAILSRYPIENFSVTPIPLRPVAPGETAEGYREARCILRAEIVKDGCPFTVFGSHFGLTDPEKQDAVAKVSELLDRETLPHVLMGDFNMQPDDEKLAPIFARMQDTAVAFDAPKLSFDSANPTIKIDYIFASNDVKILSADIPAVVISDHRPYVAELEI